MSEVDKTYAETYPYQYLRVSGPVHTIPDLLHSVLIFASDSPFVQTAPMESDVLRTSFPESNHYAVEVGHTGLLSASDWFGARVNR